MRFKSDPSLWKKDLRLHPKEKSHFFRVNFTRSVHHPAIFEKKTSPKTLPSSKRYSTFHQPSFTPSDSWWQRHPFLVHCCGCHLSWSWEPHGCHHVRYFHYSAPTSSQLQRHRRTACRSPTEGKKIPTQVMMFSLCSVVWICVVRKLGLFLCMNSL